MSTAPVAEKEFTIYLGRNDAGRLYAGMTSRQTRIREAEHIAAGGPKATLSLEEMGKAATRLDARIEEQKLINQLGGKAVMENGTLLNQRNAVAPKYWEQYNILPPQ